MINLKECLVEDSKVLSGREEGKEYRRKFNLDKLDNSNESVIVKIPEDIFSINISFFLGLFGNSIRKLGEDGFKKKYSFEGDKYILGVVNNNIKKALKTSNVLGNIN